MKRKISGTTQHQSKENITGSAIESVKISAAVKIANLISESSTRRCRLKTYGQLSGRSRQSNIADPAARPQYSQFKVGLSISLSLSNRLTI